MTDTKGTWSDGGKVWNGEPMQGATSCPQCHATVLSTSQPERGTPELEAMAETIHERCPTCYMTDVGYSVYVDGWCRDPWHADDHLRAKSASPPGTARRTEGTKMILPCPFCGYAAELRESDTCHDTWLVRCTSCQTKTVTSYTKDEAIETWNARVAPEQPAPFQPHENCNCLMCLAERAR